MPTQALFGQLLIGLINGAFYAMLSLGLAVIFGLLNIINFAHGALYMTGAFVAYFLLKLAGLGYWWSLLLAPLAVGLLGIVLEKTMLKRLLGSFAVILFVLPVTSAWADSCSDTANLFRKAGQSSQFFKAAYGYAVFPTIGKGGIGIGGAHGKGCVYAKGKYVGDTSMTQLSIGFQLGAEGFSEIIFFQDERSFKEFTAGNFEFGADAQAVAVTLAAQAKAGSTGASTGASATKPCHSCLLQRLPWGRPLRPITLRVAASPPRRYSLRATLAIGLAIGALLGVVMALIGR